MIADDRPADACHGRGDAGRVRRAQKRRHVGIYGKLVGRSTKKVSIRSISNMSLSL
jgi:hypothetical protein